MKLRIDLWNDKNSECQSCIIPLYSLGSVDLKIDRYKHIIITLPEACYGCEEECSRCSELGDE